MSSTKTVPENNSASSQIARIWAAKPQIPDKPPEAIDAHDIGRSSWPAFCIWLTNNLAGISTTLVRDEGADRQMVECLERPLESVESILQANGVMAVKIGVLLDGNRHFFEVSGPSWLRAHYNAAGFVRLIEIGYEEGKMILRFTGAPVLSSAFTANSWGE